MCLAVLTVQRLSNLACRIQVSTLLHGIGVVKMHVESMVPPLILSPNHDLPLRNGGKLAGKMAGKLVGNNWLENGGNNWLEIGWKNWLEIGWKKVFRNLGSKLGELRLESLCRVIGSFVALGEALCSCHRITGHIKTAAEIPGGSKGVLLSSQDLTGVLFLSIGSKPFLGSNTFWFKHILVQRWLKPPRRTDSSRPKGCYFEVLSGG